MLKALPLKSCITSVVLLFFLFCNSLHGIDSLQVNELTPQDYSKILEETFSSNGTPSNFSISVDSIGDDLSDGSIGQPYGTQLEKIKKARKAIKIIKETGNFILNFDGSDIIDFPVGISKKIGNVEYTMGIASMKLKATHAELEVYMQIDIPGKPPLLFGAPNIKFTKSGGIVGGACLGLLADFSIDVVKHKSVILLKAAEVSQNGLCNGGTYVSIDCTGFQELGVEADILFSRDWIKPADNAPGRVQGKFSTELSSFEDLLLSFTVDDFVINKLEDVRFRIDSMLFDFSDTREGTVAYPEGYVHPLKNTPLWKGFYIKEFQVDLPEKLTGGSPITIDGDNIIIDNTGFTGKVSAYPEIISFGGKTLNGWAFGVDTFTVDVLQQTIVEVSIDGRLQVPIFGNGKDTIPTGNNALRFQGSIASGNVYSFIASPDSIYEAGLWKADITLNSNSTFEIFTEPNDNKIKVEAILHGFVSISDDGSNSDGDNSPVEVDISNIEFEGMTLRNFDNYFEIGSFTVPSVNIEIGTFEVAIDSLKLSSTVEDGHKVAGLTFDLNIILDGDIGIDAGASFFVKGYLDEGGLAHKWKKKEFGISAVSLQASWPGVENASASLELFNDDDYGKGFRGTGGIAFEGVSVAIDAIAQFGKKDGVKYFMIDALAKFDGPSPINIAGLEVKGFGGGIYRHMSRESDIDVAMDQMVGGDINQLGAGLSGIVYNVDPSIQIGLKATVVLATSGGGGQGFNANITLGLQFGTNNNGGLSLDKLWLEGSGQFMAPIDNAIVPPSGLGGNVDISADASNKLLNNATAPSGGSATVKAYVLMDLDFQANIYNARMKLFVDSSPGGFISGNAWAAAQLNIPDNEWYVHVGLPDDRNELQLNILDALTVDINCYFAVGNTNIPDVPPATLVGFDDILDEHFNDYSGRTGNLNNGAGLIFGASLSVGTDPEDPLKFLFFRGTFNGGIGFDIGIKKQGGECADATGIDGWYAIGQVYAGFQAHVWAKIKFFGIKKNIDIFHTRVAAGLRAELPNPFYAKGFVYYELSVLGIIDFDGDFKLELGKKREDVLPEDCVIEESKGYEEVEAIHLLSIPNEDLTEVNLNATFKLNMLMPNNTQFSIYNDQSVQENYRVKVTEFAVRYQENGEAIDIGVPHPDYTFWEQGGQVKFLRYINFLPAEEDLFLTAVATLQKQNPNNGYWETVQQDGEDVQETKRLDFTTTTGFNEIPLSNFDAAYPVPNQKYFLVDQNDGYYLDLTSNQYALFSDLPEGYEVRFRFRDAVGEIVADELSYSMYDINQASTNGDNIYNEESFPGQWIDIEKTDELQVSRKYFFECAWVFIGNGQPNPEFGVEHPLFSYSFETSKYRTLTDKVKAMGQQNSEYVDGGNEYSQGDLFYSTQRGEEIWESFDLVGGDAFLPLIDVRVKIKNCQYEYWGPGDWYCNEAYYLNFAYGYLPDCSLLLNENAPVDSVQLSQDNYEGNSFQLVTDFQAHVYDHAEIIYNFLDENSVCAGTQTAPSPPSSGTPGGIFAEPIPVSEIPNSVGVLRERLVSAKFPSQQAQIFNQLASTYTNMYTRRFGTASNSALRFKDQYSTEAEALVAIGNYQNSYNAISANNGSLSNVQYSTGPVYVNGGNEPPMEMIAGGNGVTTIDGPDGPTDSCLPDWIVPYCNWPVLPQNLYDGAEYEIEVIYRLPRLPSKQTPTGTLIMKK